MSEAQKVQKTRKTRSKTLKYILLLVGFLIGASIFLYPRISDARNSYENRKLIESYRQKISTLSEDYYFKYMIAAREYNSAHTVNTIVDAFSHDGSSDAPMSPEYLALLNPSGNGIMGYVEIPRISVQLPIYHGTGREALEQGAGHLEWTSLPVGGESTHCVLSGHRGLPSAKLFTDLDQLEAGDDVYLIVLGETLRYCVDEINVVLPDSDEAMAALSIVPGEDLVTLVTCTPYGVNTHRMLVRAHRVENASVEVIEAPVIVPQRERLYVIAALAVVAAAFFPIVLLKRKHE